MKNYRPSGVFFAFLSKSHIKGSKMPTLHQVVRNGSLSDLQDLLNTSSFKRLTHTYPKRKSSILHEAVRCFDQRVFNLVVDALEKAFDSPVELQQFVNLQDDIGCTALHYAIMDVYNNNINMDAQTYVTRTTETVEKLLHIGADAWCVQPYNLAIRNDPRSGYGITPVDKMARGMRYSDFADLWTDLLDLLMRKCPMTRTESANHALLSGDNFDNSAQRRWLESVVEVGNPCSIRHLWRIVNDRVRNYLEHLCVLQGRSDALVLLIRDGSSVLKMGWWVDKPTAYPHPWYARIRRKNCMDRSVAVLGMVDRALLQPWCTSTHLRFPKSFREATATLLMCYARITGLHLSTHLLHHIYASFVQADHFEDQIWL